MPDKSNRKPSPKISAKATHSSGACWDNSVSVLPSWSGEHEGRAARGFGPKVIPLRTRLVVLGYARAVAADVGVAIKGRLIDLSFPTRDEARAWGRKTVVITVYR
jgi:3D domain